MLLSGNSIKCLDHNPHAGILLRGAHKTATRGRYTSGRRARGESWDFDHYETVNSIYIGGKLLVQDAQRLSSLDGAPIFSHPQSLSSPPLGLKAGPPPPALPPLSHLAKRQPFNLLSPCHLRPYKNDQSRHSCLRLGLLSNVRAGPASNNSLSSGKPDDPCSLSPPRFGMHHQGSHAPF